MTRSEPRVSHTCVQHFVSGLSLELFCSVTSVLFLSPGDGGTAGNMTIVFKEDAPSPARIGKWIGGSMALGFFRLEFKRPPCWVPLGAPPAGEITVNFILGTFVTRFSMPGVGGREIAKTAHILQISCSG